MFGFLNKNKQLELYAPASGELKSITEVDDAVFSEKLLGDGYAVVPNDREVTSPVNGIISTVFPTKHAFGITTPQGDDVLVHIGIDTVELKGEPFETFVQVGDKVTSKTVLAKVDLLKLAEANKDNSVMVIFTNGRDIGDARIGSRIQVLKGDLIGTL
ncbi:MULTISPECIES: PTS sugar transporter subunit IIA [unclassified Enterococcus]|uniref:PTS sugar transporter subunit IIA n=1 Tax=unclassified Enterococcus TaxID=2608891 RepID=UPI00190696F2|nr:MULTISPECIES: PTS glucose transporter subunit IIA [unclassified Enterococcus]MBK0039391.1 PTS glucose transporter subunit IIA [Enterococcus sp. S52]MBK0072041.1 PTS glucose transporter subunit IIA [Enterococcus sp. S53]MBK0142632.1 PTS glucose transporter subunit IIA [Enterococcus sp. S76]MBK0146270.1 PTS glucose transporter subunit IIA [Enterococcus sp. S77]